MSPNDIKFIQFPKRRGTAMRYNEKPTVKSCAAIYVGYDVISLTPHPHIHSAIIDATAHTVVRDIESVQTKTN